jgi:hypothetical protein
MRMAKRFFKAHTNKNMFFKKIHPTIQSIIDNIKLSHCINTRYKPYNYINEGKKKSVPIPITNEGDFYSKYTPTTLITRVFNIFAFRIEIELFYYENSLKIYKAETVKLTKEGKDIPLEPKEEKELKKCLKSLLDTEAYQEEPNGRFLLDEHEDKVDRGLKV